MAAEPEHDHQSDHDGRIVRDLRGLHGPDRADQPALRPGTVG